MILLQEIWLFLFLHRVFFSQSNPLNHPKTTIFVWLLSSILNISIPYSFQYQFFPFSTLLSLFPFSTLLSLFPFSSWYLACFFLLPAFDVEARLYHCPIPTCSTCPHKSAVSLWLSSTTCGYHSQREARFRRMLSLFLPSSFLIVRTFIF